ncbi:MAG: ABC transporter permease, partial [Erysipelotrichales bacterium]|nr:ABC transporter permease [Erysipelotrichales bacterium]
MITKKKTWFSKVYIYIILLFLYIPFIPLILFSFNDSKSLTDFTGFSLRWYQKMLEDKDIALAIINTFFIAILATLISTFIGSIASIALSRSRKILRDIVLK